MYGCIDLRYCLLRCSAFPAKCPYRIKSTYAIHIKPVFIVLEPISGLFVDFSTSVIKTGCKKYKKISNKVVTTADCLITIEKCNIIKFSLQLKAIDDIQLFLP